MRLCVVSGQFWPCPGLFSISATILPWTRLFNQATYQRYVNDAWGLPHNRVINCNSLKPDRDHFCLKILVEPFHAPLLTDAALFVAAEGQIDSD